MPIMVMIREHGRLWQAMDALSDLLTTLVGNPKDLAAAEQLLTRCRELLALLDRHNSKEEPIIYPLAETDLTVEESGELAQFLRTGRTPDGWTCQAAAD
jgi:hemerythrin-like domain-containing protein